MQWDFGTQIEYSVYDRRLELLALKARKRTFQIVTFTVRLQSKTKEIKKLHQFLILPDYYKYFECDCDVNLVQIQRVSIKIPNNRSGRIESSEKKWDYLVDRMTVINLNSINLKMSFWVLNWLIVINNRQWKPSLSVGVNTRQEKNKQINKPINK